jgi:hypothetical protein
VTSTGESGSSCGVGLSQVMSSDIEVNPQFNSTLLASLVVLVCGTGVDAVAEGSQAEIAKKLNNPIAAMISVPFQFSYDKDIGPTEKGSARC